MIQAEKIIPGFKKLTDKRNIALGVSVALLLPLLSMGPINNNHEENKIIYINEVVTSNKSGIVDEDGDYSDWIEIKNSGSIPIELKGCGLSDNVHDPFKWEFPDISINPGQCIFVFASGKDRVGNGLERLHTNFKLDSKGETLILSSNGQVIDQVKIPQIAEDTSYGRLVESREEWCNFSKTTPGRDNWTNIDEKASQNLGLLDSTVLINELLISNKSTIMDEDGEYSDWIEIINFGDTSVNLERYGLSDDPGCPFKWRFPHLIIEPKKTIIIFASGKDRKDNKQEYLHTNFKLDTDGETIILCHKDGQIIDCVKYDKILPNVSFGRQEGKKEKWLYFTMPTPGNFNNSHGFDTLDEKISDEYGILRINEVMPLNRGGVTDENGEYSDWIEIYNTADHPVDLKGYGLTDDCYDIFKWRFPEIVINPQECLVVFASGKDKWDKDKKLLHTNFKMDSTGESLLLSNAEGKIIDNIQFGKSCADISWGRSESGGFENILFDSSTPGTKNSSHFLFGYAGEMEFSHKGGFYTKPLNIELKTKSPSSTIHYTLDGSEPTKNSAVYSEPILIDKTAVVRARTFKEGYFSGPAATYTYFLNTNHTLPVIALTIDPEDLWDEKKGIYSKGRGASEEFPYVGANYWKDIEKPIHFELYEPDGKPGLSIDAGIKIFGAYSRAMPQKSFSIIARDVYGYDRINYPMFPDKHITTYKSILLRTSGQDAVLSKIRDPLVARIFKDTNVDTEAYRPSSVYINGQYWGIYNIREKISPYYIASNHDVDPENVDILEANGRVNTGSNEDYKALISFVANNDMRVDENYNYVKTKMSIENFIDYQIAEIYCANTDTGNIKFWRDRSQGGRWRWILYDTDWGFFDVKHNTLWYVSNPEGTGIGRMFSTTLLYNLLKNENFKREFIQRFFYHLNTTLKPERVIGIIDDMSNTIRPEMPKNLERWGGTLRIWDGQIQKLKDFANQRPDILLKYIQKQFGLTDEDMEVYKKGC